MAAAVTFWSTWVRRLLIISIICLLALVLTEDAFAVAATGGHKAASASAAAAEAVRDGRGSAEGGSDDSKAARHRKIRPSYGARAAPSRKARRRPRPLLPVIDPTPYPSVTPTASSSPAPPWDGVSWFYACERTPLPAALREYAAWREGKMVFLRAAAGDVGRARELQAAAGDSDPPLTLSIYGAEGGGWGDRVPAIVHLFLFAVRFRRVFFLAAPALYPWLESPFFDWRLDAATLPVLAKTLQSMSPLFTYTCDETLLCPFSQPDGDKRYPADVPISPYMVSNRGAFHPSLHPSHREWASALVGNLPACASQALLRPSAALRALPAVVDMLAAFAAARAAGRTVAGFHHRAGDAAIQLEADQQTFLAISDETTPAEARELLKNSLPDYSGSGLAALADAPGVTFLVTDSRGVREAARRAFPGLLTTDTRPMHIGNDASDANVQGIRTVRQARNISYDDSMRDVLVDWWLLANVDEYRGYIVSGFARSAIVASYAGRWNVISPPLECLEGDCCYGEHDKILQCFRLGSSV